MIGCSIGSEIWHFYLLYGIIFSLGLSISGWPQFAPLIVEWFVEKRATAFGIVGAGFGLSFLISPFTEFLILNLGWRGAFIALGMIPTLTIGPLTIFFVKRKPANVESFSEESLVNNQRMNEEMNKSYNDKANSQNELTLFKAIKTYRFWMLFFANFFIWGIGLNMIAAHQVAYVHDIGYSEVFAAAVFGLYGIMITVGNLFGFISDRIGRELTVTLGTIGAITAILLLATISDPTSPWKVYIYSILFGFSLGISSPAMSAIPGDLFQGKNFGVINGFLMLGFGFGGSLGPWIGGYIFDTIGSYIPAFFMVVLSLITACLLIWLVAPRKMKKY
jgi:MFS family permease